MKCQLCQAELDETDQSDDSNDEVFCPQCRDKMASTSVEGLLDSLQPWQPPIAQTADSESSPSLESRGREVWRSSSTDELRTIWPISAALHPSGDILILDEPDNYRLLRLDQNGRCLGVLAEIANGEADGEIDDPHGVCLDVEGRFYIPDAGNDRIAIWNADGSFSHCLGIDMLAHPEDVDVDAELFIYITDTFNRRILKLSPEGLCSLDVSDLGPWGRLDHPVAITTDSQENIYVGDEERNMVVKLTPDGAPMMVLPGANDDPHLFDGPGDIRLAPDGTFYVSDKRNLRIRRFNPDGIVTGIVDKSRDADDTHDGGDITIAGGHVVIPDRVNDVVWCMEFEKV